MIRDFPANVSSLEVVGQQADCYLTQLARIEAGVQSIELVDERRQVVVRAFALHTFPAHRVAVAVAAGLSSVFAATRADLWYGPLHLSCARGADPSAVFVDASERERPVAPSTFGQPNARGTGGEQRADQQLDQPRASWAARSKQLGFVSESAGQAPDLCARVRDACDDLVNAVSIEVRLDGRDRVTNGNVEIRE